MERIAGHQAAPGFDDRRERIDLGDRGDPALQQVSRHVDRRGHQDHEQRQLHRRRGLQRAQTGHHTGREEERGHVHHERQPHKAGEIDAVAADLHARGEGDAEDDDPNEYGADEPRDPVPRDHGGAVARREEQPACETGVEVGADREADEHPSESSRLEQHEDELERVVVVVPEPGEAAHRRQAAGERHVEEERERERRQQ